MTSLIAFYRKSAILECTREKIVLTCCVVGCSNRGGRDRGVSFYHIPAVLEHQGEKAFELSSKRRQEWIARINRKDWVPSKNVRVCSDHFVSGMF